MSGTARPRKSAATSRPLAPKEEDRDEVAVEAAAIGEAARAAADASMQAPAAPVESAVGSDGRPAKQPKVIIVLERACLETGKVGKPPDHAVAAAAAGSEQGDVGGRPWC